MPGCECLRRRRPGSVSRSSGAHREQSPRSRLHQRQTAPEACLGDDDWGRRRLPPAALVHAPAGDAHEHDEDQRGKCCACMQAALTSVRRGRCMLTDSGLAGRRNGEKLGIVVAAPAMTMIFVPRSMPPGEDAGMGTAGGMAGLGARAGAGTGAPCCCAGCGCTACPFTEVTDAPVTFRPATSAHHYCTLRLHALNTSGDGGCFS